MERTCWAMKRTQHKLLFQIQRYRKYFFHVHAFISLTIKPFERPLCSQHIIIYLRPLVNCKTSLIYVILLSRPHLHLSPLHSRLETQWNLTALKTVYKLDSWSIQSGVPNTSLEWGFSGSFVVSSHFLTVIPQASPLPFIPGGRLPNYVIRN